MWCTTSNSYVNPGVLDLLATQYQSGPVETVACVPAAVGPDGGITVLSECAVTNTYMSPGALDLLAPQARSGPAQTMTCVPTTGGAGVGNGVVVLSACTVSNGYMNPGVLGLLSPQFQSGPVQTVTCVPAAVVAENATGSSPGKAVDIAGSSGDLSGTARNTRSAGGSRGNAADPSAAAQGLAGFGTEQSVLAATGPAGSLFVGRGLSELLIGLGVLGLRIARANTTRPSASGN
jgi:hypothetical protein